MPRVYGALGLGIEGYLFKKSLDGGYPPINDRVKNLPLKVEEK